MTSYIEKKRILEFCRIPAENLENHPNSKVNMKLFDSPEDAMNFAGNVMADEILHNNKLEKITRWVLPAGPMEQYETFINRVNSERIDLHNLHIAHMDDFLTWEGRALPLDHPYNLEGRMLRQFYGRIDSELLMPKEQIYWPRVNDPDSLDKAVEAIGGLDTVYAGMGFTGVFAYNEPPRSPWSHISVEDFAASKTRIVVLNDDTIVSLAVRSRGGLTHIVPPMAITIGFKSLLNTERVVVLCTTGSWKRTAIRMLMFSEPTIEYPATLFTKRVPEVVLVTDKNTIVSPIPPDQEFD